MTSVSGSTRKPTIGNLTELRLRFQVSTYALYKTDHYPSFLHRCRESCVICSYVEGKKSQRRSVERLDRL
ncbi:hypothetical protein D918_04606 [Trichuris suis]|nr:hypothetical protein D918_04606 [Trichuris suis]